MKRLKITSVLLSATMCLSMLTTPVGVWADETPAPSETQTSETTEKEEPKESETEKPDETETPEGTEKPEAETPKESESETEPAETKPESTEPSAETPSETETQPSEPAETTEPEETKPSESVPNETEPTEPEESEDPGNEETLPEQKAKSTRKNEIYDSGVCGENLTWYVVRRNGDEPYYDILYIEGYGDMYDYSEKNPAPWSCYKGNINFVNFAENVTSIGNYAFYASSITGLFATSNLKRIGDYAFCWCGRLQYLELPQGLTTIGAHAFEDSDVDTIYIPNSVTSIGEGAFRYCSGLKEITIPGSIKTISADILDSCSSLRKVTYLDGVTTLDNAFGMQPGPRIITIPKSVKTIKDGAFAYAQALTDVYYCGTEDDWHRISIGTNNMLLVRAQKHFSSYAATGDYYILTWTLDNNGLLTITGSGDMGNTVNGPSWRVAKDSIKSVVFNGNITSIASGAFEGCTNLTSITIPVCVTKIESNAFSGCSSLTNIVIPEGVTEIGDNAFEYCTSLKSISLPKSITKIGANVLNGSYWVNDINYTGTKEDWEKISIDANNEDLGKATIHLIDGTVIPGNKADNTLKVTGGKTAKIKYRKLRKKARTISRSKVMSVSAPQGTVTYKLVSVKKSKYKKYFKINATTGTITVKKKLKRGTYTIKCNVTAAGNKDYKNKTQTVTFKIKVK